MDLSESRQKDGSYVVLLPVSDTFIWPTQGGCNRWCLYNCITIQGHLMHTFWHYLITNQGNSDLHLAPVMFSQCIITMLHNLYRLNVRSITTFVRFFFFCFPFLFLFIQRLDIIMFFQSHMLLKKQKSIIKSKMFF